MKVLIDANLSPHWVDYLVNHGIEAIHWYAVGKQDAPDIEIMAYAVNHGHLVLTRDLDFGTLLVQLEALHPSVIQIRANPAEPSFVGIQMLNALRVFERELLAGALITVDPKRTRARMLPFETRPL